MMTPPPLPVLVTLLAAVLIIATMNMLRWRR